MKWGLPQKIGVGAASLIVLAAVVYATQAGHAGHAPAMDRNQVLLAQASQQKTPVNVVRVDYGSVTQALSLTGTIQSPRSANVSAAVPGQVQAVYVTEGSRVNAGTLLALLNPAQAQTQVTQAQQGVLAAQSAYLKAVQARELEYRQAAGDVATARLAVREAQTGVKKANTGASAGAIAQVEAQASQAHAGAAEAAASLKRTQFLYSHGVVPKSTLDDVQTKATQAADAAAAADAAVQQAREGATAADRQLAADKLAQAEEGLRQATTTQGTRDDIANSDVQAAVTQVASAKAQLQAAELASQATRVVSPIAGVVSTVQIHVGETAMPGAPLFTITAVGPNAGVYFETAVSESERRELTGNPLATVTVQAAPGHSFNGRVTEVLPVQNPGSLGFLVRIAINSGGMLIPPGAYARANVQVAVARHVLIVPTQAVLTGPSGAPLAGSAEGAFVYIVSSSNLAERRPVTLGVSDGVHVEVVTGLKQGDLVVVVGQELLHNGAPVKILPPITTSAS